MKGIITARTLLAVLFVLTFLFDSSSVFSQDSREKKEEKSGEKFLLRYRFEKGEILKWTVNHRLAIRTAVGKTDETLETFCRSTKIWTVKDLDKDGNALIEHQVENVEMLRKQPGKADSSFNSDKNKTPPPDFVEVAKNIGIPLANITLTPTGDVVKKIQLVNYVEGAFENKVLITMPKEPIPIGETWKTPFEIILPQPNGTVKKISARQVFELKSVKLGIATVAFHTEILSPISDQPQLEVKLLDRCIEGTLTLDTDNGRLMSQQTEIDKRVIGFQGAGSSMHHKLRLTEELKIR